VKEIWSSLHKITVCIKGTHALFVRFFTILPLTFRHKILQVLGLVLYGDHMR